MAILITPTLLNSYDFYSSAIAPQWKAKAFEEIVGTLTRTKKWDPSPAVKKGIEFETAIYNVCNDIAKGRPLRGSELFQKVVTACLDADFQHKVKYIETIDDQDYVLYGKLDVYFEKGSRRYENGHIIDIKTTGKFSGPEKYTEGWQHKVYCVATGIPTFDYVVAEWKSKTEFTLVDVHTVTIDFAELHTVREAISDKVREFVAWTQAMETEFGLYTALTTTYSNNSSSNAM